MKTITMISALLVGALAMPAAMEAKTIPPPVGMNQLTGKCLKKKNVPAEGCVYKPGMEKFYKMKSGATDFSLYSTTTYAYDEKGRVTQALKDFEDYGKTDMTVYTYNANGEIENETLSTGPDKEHLVTTSRYRYVYDTVLTWFRTTEEHYTVSGGEEKLVDCDEVYIERDEAGNVVRIVPTVFSGGSFTDGKPTVLTYKDGVPVEIKDTNEGITMTDIKWEACNGQIVGMDLFTMMAAGNKPLSFIMVNTKEGMSAEYAFEYSDGQILATVSQGPMVLEMTLIGVDNDAREQISLVNMYMVSGGEKTLLSSSYSELSFDSFGNELRDIEYTLEDGEYDIDSWYAVTEISSVAAIGYPGTMITSKFEAGEDADMSAEMKSLPLRPELPPVEGEWEDVYKVEFSDFKEFARIEGVVADDADVEPVYYNLHGVRVSNPQKGLYIELRGTKARKVIF